MKHMTACLLQGRRTAPHVDTPNQGSAGSLQVKIIMTLARITLTAFLSIDEYQRTPAFKFCIPTRFLNLTILRLNSTTSLYYPPFHILSYNPSRWTLFYIVQQKQMTSFSLLPLKNVQPFGVLLTCGFLVSRSQTT